MTAPDAKPRWGDQGRDRKALAILGTLADACGHASLRGRWLDVGCGSGGIAAGLAPHVDRIDGIDPERWPTWSGLTDMHRNLALHEGAFDADEPPMPDGVFDVVICNQVYEHVADPARLIRNLGRVIRPGGCCYFAGPNLLWPVEPHVFWPVVHWLPRRTAQAVMAWLGSKRSQELDAYSATCWQLRRWFREAGFEVRWAFRERLAVELRARGFPRLGALVGAVPAWMYRLGEPAAPGLVYVLTRPGPAGAGNG